MTVPEVISGYNLDLTRPEKRTTHANITVAPRIYGGNSLSRPSAALAGPVCDRRRRFDRHTPAGDSGLRAAPCALSELPMDPRLLGVWIGRILLDSRSLGPAAGRRRFMDPRVLGV